MSCRGRLCEIELLIAAGAEKRLQQIHAPYTEAYGEHYAAAEGDGRALYEYSLFP